MEEHSYYVYILASDKNGTLYTGVTRDIIHRTWQHKTHETRGFTEKYEVTMLVYFEEHHDIEEAIRREKLIKRWPRKWKLELIEKENPNWDDLYSMVVDAYF